MTTDKNLRKFTMKVSVPDTGVVKTLNVKGESTISEITLNLVETLGPSKNWSRYSLWCTDKKTWLIAPRATLNTYGLDAGNKVIFTTTNKPLVIQLPDRTTLNMEKADFSNTLFSVVCTICRELRVRHPEELSLLRCAKEEQLKDARSVTARRTFRVKKSSRKSKKDRNDNSQNSMNNAGAAANGDVTLSPNGSIANVAMLTPDEIDGIDIKEGKVMEERAAMNAGWLDSSKSLMEQDVQEGDILLLRFKYFAFLDLNQQRDEPRINFLYHQAIRSVLSEDVVPTETESLEFAAYQFAVEQATRNPPKLARPISPGRDDLDSALADLEVSLGANDADLEKMNQSALPNYNRELQANLKFKKQRRFFFFAKPKLHKFTFRDTTMSFFKNNSSGGPPDFVQDLKDCSIVPEVDVRKQKYILHIKPPTAKKEYLVLFSDKDEFCNWTAACRLASKGKPISDSTYDGEIELVKTMCNMQEHSQTLKLARNKTTIPTEEIKTEDFVSARVSKKYKPEQLANKILDAHNVLPRKDYTATELKLRYILKWERLNDFGMSYFVVKFANSKKEELLGIARTHMVKYDLNTPHDVVKTWHWTSLQSWNVNWEVKTLTFNVDTEQLSFECHSADIKIVHEYIGGYIFLTLRKETDTELDKEMFYKLTGGWQ